MTKKLLSALKTLGRVLKNLFLRPFRALRSRTQSTLNSNKLVSTVQGTAKKLPKILKSKPEKREDYYDWGSFYVAKSLVTVLIVLLIALPLLYIFLLHPLLTKWFWVKDFVVGDSDLSSYSGRVAVYYDEKHLQPEFIGRLKDGMATDQGEEYYINGNIKYVGGFEGGVYEGLGEYTDENGGVYKGSFSNGKINGTGTLTLNGVLYYDGNFSDGKMEGEGKILYPDGMVHLSGNFTDGVLNGSALEYHPNGTIMYNGSFTSGLYNGNGVLYSDSGKKLYSGEFDMGQYSGSGTLYDADGTKLYTGEFEDGVYSGSGTLYTADGSVTVGSFSEGQIIGAAERTFLNGRKYEGCFSDNLMNGTGTLSDVAGKFSYYGEFLDDDFDYSEIFASDAGTIKNMMPSLLQTVDSDCFYLADSNFGVAIRCNFAADTQPAAATEIFTVPISGTQTEIRSVNDINAPHALTVSEKNDITLPQWAAKEFGIPITGVRCYAAQYSDMTVYFWVNKANFGLVLKSAKPAENSNIGTGGLPGVSGDPESGLSAEEILALFRQLGLDPADFPSLGLDF